MKALVGAVNQEKDQVGAFSLIVKSLPMVRLQLYFEHLNFHPRHAIRSENYDAM